MYALQKHTSSHSRPNNNKTVMYALQTHLLTVSLKQHNSDVRTTDTSSHSRSNNNITVMYALYRHIFSQSAEQQHNSDVRTTYTSSHSRPNNNITVVYALQTHLLTVSLTTQFSNVRTTDTIIAIKYFVVKMQWLLPQKHKSCKQVTEWRLSVTPYLSVNMYCHVLMKNAC